MSTGRSGRTRTYVIALAMTSLLVAATSAQAADLNGSVSAWGTNASGQLGDGTTTGHRTAAAVRNLTRVDEIAGGRDFAFALSEGAVFSWGANESGQLGDGTVGRKLLPVQVGGLLQGLQVAEIASGHYHSLAATANGNVYSWGRNNNGQLGDGTTTKRTRPVLVTGVPAVRLLAGGRDHSLALATNDTVWAWGSNAFGQIGDGSTTPRRTRPVQVTGLPIAGDAVSVVAIAAGREHSLAVLSTGAVWAWGSNVYGQLGDNSKTNRRTPVLIAGLAATEVRAGAHHSFALRTNGTVASWGRNYRGELGDGSTTSTRTTPTTVADLSGVVSIGTGRDHGLAVLATGTLRSWGYNAGGQLGDDSFATRRRPVTVIGVTGAELAEGGGDYSVVLTR